MDDITVLITGSGAPGIQGTIYSLKNNFDKRNIQIIGTDIRVDVVGAYLCDAFYQITRPEKPKYLEQLLSICAYENVDVVIPQNTTELSVLANNKSLFQNNGTEVLVSDPNCIAVANNKYQLLLLAEQKGIPTPKFFQVTTFDNLENAAKELGWPKNPIVIKPPASNGMRGVRIIDESFDRKKLFYEEKPTTLYLKMNNLYEILRASFAPLLVMEYLPGDEFTVDVLKTDEYCIVPRRRNRIQSGITFYGTVEKRDDIIQYSKRLSTVLGSEYAFGFQFKEDEDGVPKLLECNPRVQGTMVLSTFAGANIIYGAVKQSLNEPVPEFQVDWNTKILRYWGGLGIKKGKVIGHL